MRQPCFWLCMLSLCVVPAAYAATSGDLHTTLSQMHVTKPLSASIHIHDHETTGKKDDVKSTDTRLTLHVDAAADGLNIHFPAKLLTRANKEARAQAKDPDASGATMSALTTMDPTLFQSLTDFTPALLNKLVGATLKSQKNVIRDGHPAELMTFSIPSGVGTEDKDAIKDYSGYLKVWVGADGVPVAAQDSQQYKGRKFFISFSFGTVRNYTFQQIGQRLVVTRYARDEKSSGLGQLSHSEVDIMLEPSSGSVSPNKGG